MRTSFSRYRKQREEEVLSLSTIEPIPAPPVVVNERDSTALNDKIQKSGGRPKGSSIFDQFELNNRTVQAKNEATTLMKEQKTKANKEGLRVRKDLFENIIKNVKKEMNVPDNVRISVDALRKRIIRK